MFTFGPGSTRQCVGITVQEDGVVEGEEDFILTLNSTDDVVLVPDTATVVIEDFDESESCTICLSCANTVKLDFN